MKTSELTGAALDWAVAKCEGRDTRPERWRGKMSSNCGVWQPSVSWTQGGRIIEREKINVYFDDVDGKCAAAIWKPSFGGGTLIASSKNCPTPLIAAMQCYVTSKLGAEIEIPKELQ